MSRAANVHKQRGRVKGLPAPATRTPPTWAAVVALAVSIGIVYAPFLSVPFVFDDDPAIVKNTSITSFFPLIGTAEQPGPLNPPRDLPTAGRPLVNLSLAINYAFGGLDPYGYHLLNAAIHFLSALLLFAIVRRTLLLPYFKSRFDDAAGWLAFAVAMLWALHPLQTEAVIYATQRTELMMALFYVATLYFSLRYWAATDDPQTDVSNPRQNRARTMWLVLATISCWCGMASKEVMVSAPLTILLFERTFVAGSVSNSIRRSWPLHAGLASSWILLFALNISAPRSESAGFMLEVPAVDWWLTQTKVLLVYLKLVVWPRPLLFHYELPYLTTIGQAWMYVLPVFALGVTTLVLLWLNRPLGYLGTWVFAILAPTSVVPIVTEMAADRRMYLPLAAIAVLFVVGSYVIVQRWMLRGPSTAQTTGALRPPIAAVVIPALLLAVVYGVASARHLPTYRTATNLWRDVLHYQPHNSLAHLSLGLVLSTAGQWPEATEHLKTAADLRPNDPSAFNGLGRALTNTGHLPEAIEAFHRALELNPEYALALNNLGFALNESGRYSEAVPHLEHALRLMPDLPEAHNNLGISLGSTGNTAQAVVHFRRAVQLDKKFPEPRKNLAFGLAQMGNLSLAIEQYKEAIRLKPDYWSAYLGLAQTLAAANRSNEAIAVAQRAIGAARAARRPAESEAIESWLKNYQSAGSK